MGMILSKFRKKKSAIETLEKLENDIKEIEENRSYAQMRHEKVTKRLFLYSVGLYVLCGVIFYFQYTSTLKGKLLYLVPLALSPLLLFIISKIISWYYIRLIKKNQLRLNEMKKIKKKILEEVMDKETYKVAKEILDKYSTETVSASAMQLTTAKYDPGLRRRIVAEKMPNPQPTRIMGRGHSLPQQNRPIINALMPARPLPVGGPMMRLPAPVLPTNRSYIDRVVEYLIGDGPNNRYALICSCCHSHNGMALKEEFEYIGFKCCYCFFYNPARKIRPQAPKLDVTPRQNNDSEVDSDSDSKDSVNLEIVEEPETATSDNSVDINKEVILEKEDLKILQPPIQDCKIESNNCEIRVENKTSDNISTAFENVDTETNEEICESDEKNVEEEIKDPIALNKISDEETLSKS